LANNVDLEGRLQLKGGAGDTTAEVRGARRGWAHDSACLVRPRRGNKSTHRSAEYRTKFSWIITWILCNRKFGQEGES
jgi:hypothetical protein